MSNIASSKMLYMSIYNSTIIVNDTAYADLLEFNLQFKCSNTTTTYKLGKNTVNHNIWGIQ